MSHTEFKIYKIFFPIAWMYGVGVWIRNYLFDKGILKSKSFLIPVLSVGNLTVGGTGKTPHTEYLIRLLKDEFSVAVLSRGYKRKSKGFLLSDSHTTMNQVGDEPFQMKKKYPSVRIAVDKDRCHGIEQLAMANLKPATEVIILDDSYQHRYVKPGLNILLVDYNRLITRDALLPVGRLREPVSEKRRANIIIITKCPEEMKPVEFRLLTRELEVYPYQDLFFSTFRYGKMFKLFGQGILPLEKLVGDEQILLLTGIASPKPMIKKIKKYNRHIYPLTFADHHNFTDKDIQEINNRFKSLSGDKRLVITTEKDASRLLSMMGLLDEVRAVIYVLPIEVIFLRKQETIFNEKIRDYVRKN